MNPFVSLLRKSVEFRRYSLLTQAAFFGQGRHRSVYVFNFNMCSIPQKMKYKFPIFLALLGLLPWTAPAETVIKILHIAKLPKVQEIWAEAGHEYEKAHPGVKVEFFYLENEAFKAKLPT